MKSSRIATWVLAAAALVAASTTFAQTWPSKPVRWISPFPAGGGTDAFARPLAAQVSKQLGQQVLIENIGGAGGTLGAGAAAKQPPDGYTFLVGAVHHAIAESVYAHLNYNLQKDLLPVTMVAVLPNVIVVHPKVPVSSVRELIAYAKQNPGRLNFASAGNGTSHHLAGELFMSMTGVQMAHIPYKGAGPMMQDLIAGQVDVAFDGMGSSAPQIRAGKLRPLAVSTRSRVPAFPDVPTVAETVPGYEVQTWYGLFAVAGTPQEIVDRMQAEVAKALQDPQIKEIWLGQGATEGGWPQARFADFVRAEIVRWARVVKDAGVKIDN